MQAINIFNILFIYLAVSGVSARGIVAIVAASFNCDMF